MKRYPIDRLTALVEMYKGNRASFRRLLTGRRWTLVLITARPAPGRWTREPGE